MLLAVVLGFCSTTIFALHHEGHKQLLRQSPQSQSPNAANEPLQVYNGENFGSKKVQETNTQRTDNLLGGQYPQSRYFANSGDLLNNINALVNVLPQNGALEPNKLQYVTPVIENLVAKSPIDNYKLSNILMQLKELSNSNTQDKLPLKLINNENNLKVKISLEYNLPTAEKCQSILGVLIDYINTAHKQIGEYCKQTGQCDPNLYANISRKIPLILKSYVENTLSKTQQNTNIFSSINDSEFAKLGKGNNELNNFKKNIGQEYDILNIQPNNIPKPELNELRELPNENILNLQSFTYDKVPKIGQILNLNANTNLGSTITGLNYNLQTSSPYKPIKNSDLSTKSIQEILSLLKPPVGDYVSQYEAADANTNLIKLKKDGDLVENLLEYPNLLNLENNKNKPNKIGNVDKSVSYTHLGLQQQPFKDAPFYAQTFPTNIATKEFQSSVSSNIGILDTRQNLLDNEPLQEYQNSIFQANQPVNQENLKRITEAITKMNFQKSNSPNYVNTSPYLYEIYNRLVSPSINVNQPDLGRLTTADAKGEQSIYVSPNLIHTFVSNNNKQLNYGNQLTDFSRLLGVSNLVKLNSVPNQSEVVELTYKIRRPTTTYEPSYFVKYRLPYKHFFNKIQSILEQKPHLRTTQQQLYLELLNDSNLAETSANLKGVNHDELIKLIANSGALVDAKIITSDLLRTSADEQLQIIKDINANLSLPNLYVNANGSENLGVIQKLVNATETSTLAVPATANSFTLLRSNVQTPLDGYVKSQSVYQPSQRTFNPYYNQIIQPYYSSRIVSPQTFYRLPSSYYYKKIYKNIPPVKTMLPIAQPSVYTRNIYPNKLINTYPQTFG